MFQNLTTYFVYSEAMMTYHNNDKPWKLWLSIIATHLENKTLLELPYTYIHCCKKTNLFL